jgi:ATP-dependent RNA helicase DeaD
MKDFKELNLKPELLEALKTMNFLNMTEVQELAIPVVLEHKDLIVRSKTGSGKTGAFLVPIFQTCQPIGHPQAIVIVPTRELAVQVASVAQKLAHKSRMGVTVVYGGASINVQMSSLRRGSDIIIGTPGRIIDLMDRGALKLSKIRFVVLDEADLMLDMGFIEDVEYILSNVPRERQTILLSATMPREISDISRKHMKNDVTKLTVGDEEEMTVNTITHSYFIASGKVKFAALLAYIDKFEPKKCIIFTSTQRESEYVHSFLSDNGFNAIVMHGGLTQSMRERSLHEFRTRARFLISTNLASRGLDIPDITDIINFDAPDDPRIYVHRVGRSARMGKDGRAFTMFGYDQEGLMEQTKRVANVKMNHVELDTVKFKDIPLPAMRRSSPRRFGGDGSSFRGGSSEGRGPSTGEHRGFNQNRNGPSSSGGGFRDRTGGGRYSNRKKRFGGTRHEYGGGDRRN